MESEQIFQWCDDKGIDVKNSFVLSGVSLDVTDEIVYMVLDEAKVFGRFRVRGRHLTHTDDNQSMLIETTTDMTKADIPEELMAGDQSELWVVSVPDIQSSHKSFDQGRFQSRLALFLANEGKTLDDLTGFRHSTSAPPTVPDLNTELVNAISALVEKCQVSPMDGQGYRKLRFFSGVNPTPHGEEEYDSWAEQTTHLLDEWQCSDVVKKQRIAESLKGPAADIVRGLRGINPQATSSEYLEALETAFGTTDSAADLLVRFRNTFQQDTEKLSEYLLRLDKLLHAVHRKGGIDVADMNRARVEQIARGALTHDLAALRIRMTYKLKPPPSFTELLREVREEESLVFERERVNEVVSASVINYAGCATASVAPKQSEFTTPAPAAVEGDPAIESLKNELQGLKNDVARLLSASVATSESLPQHVIQNCTQKAAVKYAGGKERTSRSQYRADVFCYKCGEDGHFQRECENQENLKKVNKRLLKARQTTGNFPGAQ